jgi:thiol-disulfide isomerase/thioredoxin
MELYNKSGDVVILGNKSFIATNGKVRLNSSHFKGPGVLKVYANWCPHCQNKASFFNELATRLKRQGHRSKIYVLNADIAKETCKLLNAEYLPTMFKVNSNGTVGNKIELTTPQDVLKYL